MTPSTSKSPKTATVSPVRAAARRRATALSMSGSAKGSQSPSAVEEACAPGDGRDAAAFEEALDERRVVGEAEVAGVRVGAKSPATL